MNFNNQWYYLKAKEFCFQPKAKLYIDYKIIIENNIPTIEFYTNYYISLNNEFRKSLWIKNIKIEIETLNEIKRTIFTSGGLFKLKKHCFNIIEDIELYFQCEEENKELQDCKNKLIQLINEINKTIKKLFS